MAARDWRAFALQALERPEEGGLFYAGYVIHICSRGSVQDISAYAQQSQLKDVAETGTVNPKIAAAAESLSAQCGSFAPGETMQLHLKVKARESEGKDPLVAAQRAALDAAYGPAPDKPKVRAAVERLLQLADPLLLSKIELLQFLAVADARPVEGLVFDGRLVPHSAGVELSKASFAMHLGVCRDGAPCGVVVELRIACAVARNCRTREEYAQLLFEQAGGDEAAFQEVLILAERVREAIARREVRFFVQ